MSDPLRRSLVRIAADLPKGDPTRRKILAAVSKAGGVLSAARGESKIPLGVQIEKVYKWRGGSSIYIEGAVNGVDFECYVRDLDEFRDGLRSGYADVEMESEGGMLMEVSIDGGLAGDIYSVMWKALAAYYKKNPELMLDLEG